MDSSHATLEKDTAVLSVANGATGMSMPLHTMKDHLQIISEALDVVLQTHGGKGLFLLVQKIPETSHEWFNLAIIFSAKRCGLWGYHKEPPAGHQEDLVKLAYLPGFCLGFP